MRVVCMHVYSVFLLLKIGSYRHLFLGKIIFFSFGGHKKKYFKNLRQQFYSAFNFTSFGVYGWCFTSNLHNLEAFKHLLLFDPKSGEASESETMIWSGLKVCIGVQKLWTSENVRIRFGLRSVVQYFLGQFLDRPLATANFTHFSTLWASGTQFSERYCIVRFSL